MSNATLAAPVHRATAVLPRIPAAPGMARHWALGLLATWGVQVPLDDVELDLSELVTNAVRHAAGATITTRMRQYPDRLRVAVIDQDPRRVAMPGERAGVEESAESGRGLILVEATTAACGCRVYATRKSMWAQWDLVGAHPIGGA